MEGGVSKKVPAPQCCGCPMKLIMQVPRLGKLKGLYGFRCDECGKVQFVDEQ